MEGNEAQKRAAGVNERRGLHRQQATSVLVVDGVAVTGVVVVIGLPKRPLMAGGVSIVTARPSFRDFAIMLQYHERGIFPAGLQS